jgi:hypothetical protein
MSFTIVNQAVAKVVMEAKLSVIDDIVTYLETKIEVDDDLKSIFIEFKANLKEYQEKVVKEAGKKSKVKKSHDKKRAPSVFNLYVKDIMPDIKAKHPDIKDGKQMIGFASESWKTDPLSFFLKEKILELKSDHTDKDIVELYAMAKAMYVDEKVISKK